MIETTEGPFVYSGDTGNGLNAANSLGVRAGESGMSTNRDVGDIQPHRKPPEFGGSQKNSALYKIDTEILDKYGLEAVNDHGTHYEIRTKKGIEPSELGDRLAKTKGEWKKVKVCN